MNACMKGMPAQRIPVHVWIESHVENGRVPQKLDAQHLDTYLT